MLWAYRRELKKAALLCLGTAIPMGLAYVVWQPTAFGQVLRNGTYVSVGSWANPPFRLLNLFLGEWGAKTIVGVIAYSGLVVIAWMLSRVVPWTAAPGLPRGCRSAARPDDHRAAHLVDLVGGLADHLDVHAGLVRPAGLDAARPDGGQQARPDPAAADHVAVARLRARAGWSTSDRRWSSSPPGCTTPCRRSSRSVCWSPSSCGGASRIARSCFPFRDVKETVVEPADVRSV